jgi:hypothetical protein
MMRRARRQNQRAGRRGRLLLVCTLIAMASGGVAPRARAMNQTGRYCVHCIEFFGITILCYDNDDDEGDLFACRQ